MHLHHQCFSCTHYTQFFSGMYHFYQVSNEETIISSTFNFIIEKKDGMSGIFMSV